MGLFGSIKSFVIENFWKPVTNESVYYNPFNTAVYAVAFALAAAYAGLPILRKLNISLDREFFKAITPYVFLGGALRSLKDIDIVTTILLETPFIYGVMFFYTVSALYFARKASDNYRRIFFWLGTIPLAVVMPLYLMNMNSIGFEALVTSLFIFLALNVMLFLIVNVFNLSIYTFMIPVAAHLWDATTSFVAISYGAAEKHVLGNAFINIFGPEGMFLMKFLIVVPAVYYINKEVEGEEKLYYLFLIALLGFALGTRNILSLITAPL